MKTLIIILTVLFILSGCNDNTETVQTVDWYKSHNAERKTMLTKCNNNPGELMLTPNCINADKAKSSLFFSKKSEGTKVKPLEF